MYPGIVDLYEVNERINRLPYKADPPTLDDWTPIDVKGGDCDSYMTAKLVALYRLGWPIVRLRMATCYVETGEYHAVLVVAPDSGGERVLDNRQRFPMLISELHDLGYRPDKIQRDGGSMEWVQWQWLTKA